MSEGALEGEEAGKAVGGEAAGGVAGGCDVAVAQVEALGVDIINLCVQSDEGVS